MPEDSGLLGGEVVFEPGGHGFLRVPLDGDAAGWGCRGARV